MQFKPKKPALFLFFIGLFVFSCWLMWKTFRVSESGNLKIAIKVWSDFAATIPLIRSFSLGQNFPPQYPLFSGPPIKYHFVFFFVVGMLEKIGIRLDWALNSLSILGFFGLLLTIYFLSRELFKKKAVSALSCIFFLFNGSLSFVEFFKKHPLSFNTPREIFYNTTFPAFAPYDGSHLVSAFWSLNIFINQRHLAFAYALFLLFLLIIYRASKKSEGLSLNTTLILGIVLGCFPFIHLTVFAMTEISLGILFLFIPHIRKKLLLLVIVSVIIALPQIMYMGESSIKTALWHPGYLLDNLTTVSFIKYWFFNLGLVSIFAPLGFLLTGKKQRQIFLIFLAFFVVGNLCQFSPEIAANHKFFNLFIIGANIFAAYFIYRLWKKNVWAKILAVLSVFFMTLSGIIDLTPIKNDTYAEIPDYRNNSVSQFIIKNTSPQAIFINASYLYDPASLAGRKIYLGWLYFPWSAGYKTDERMALLKSILESTDKKSACSLLKQERIDYLEIQKPAPFEKIQVNYQFFQNNFTQIFFSPSTSLYIYDIRLSCE